MTKTYYHVTPVTHSAGVVIPRGSYLKDADTDAAYVKDDPNQEFLRERIRLKHYPEKPSRFKASFVFERLEDATFFRDNLRQGHRIYRVRFLNSCAEVHRVCYTAWKSDHHNIEQQAHDFWSSPSNYSSNSEVFAESDLVVESEA